MLAIFAARNESVAQKYKINPGFCLTGLSNGFGKLHDEHARACFIKRNGCQACAPV